MAIVVPDAFGHNLVEMQSAENACKGELNEFFPIRPYAEAPEEKSANSKRPYLCRIDGSNAVIPIEKHRERNCSVTATTWRCY